MAEFPLGIQSYCFREFREIQALVGVLRQVGLTFVEIYPGHIDYHGDQRKADEAFQIIRHAGISVSAYGGVSLGNDESDTRRLCELARRNGIRYLTVVGVEESALPVLERLAEEYGVFFCIHNHGRKSQFGTFAQCQGILGRTSTAFGLCNDTAWFLESGEDPVAAVDVFSERLYGVHLKDFRFDSAGRPVDVVIGTGGLDLPRLMQRLASISFGGYLSLEYEGDPANPVPAVIECLRAVTNVQGRGD